MLEKTLESKLVREVNKRGGLCLKWVSPGTRGVPDRIVILDGAIHFVEMKKPKTGKLSKIQDSVIDQIQKRGKWVEKILNEEQLKTFLNEI